MHGHTFTTFFCEGRYYLPWLTRAFLAAGGRMQGRKLTSLRVRGCILLLFGLSSAILWCTFRAFPLFWSLQGSCTMWMLL